MGKVLAGVLVVVAVVVGALWWWIHRPQQEALEKARSEADGLRNEILRCSGDLRGFQGKVADLEVVKIELEKASTELKTRVEEREAELANLRGTQDELLSGLKSEIESQQIQVQRYRDQLRVDVVDEVLFDSGEAALKPAGRAILQKVGDVLKKAEGRHIDVQGHTDNVPIKGALAQRYATNWELSAARAVNVARFLQDTTTIEPNRLTATAHSEYQPRNDNATEEGRRKNRRIEILLGPKPVAEPSVAAAP